ncbi:MAG: tetratricopeptide repeat protein [Aquificaceae bacterium]|nr:tetratricopeptide repeat protein [Aquificaceae bacterium]
MFCLSVSLISCGGITREEFEKRNAALESRIAKLEEGQRLLEDKNTKTEGRVDTLSESLTGIRLELERLKVKGANPQEVVAKPTEPKRETPPQPKQQEAPKSEVATQNPTEDYQREYDEALKLYNLRQLHQARDRFIEFIKKNPRTPLTDNAYLWLGVVYRDLGETNKAEAVWLTLVERCQRKEMVDCNKAPSALLQLARLYEQRGDTQKAKEFYEAIIREYPLSEESGVAKTKLGK